MAAGYYRNGQGLSDCGRVRPGPLIGIRPAAAKSLCKILAGCSFGCCLSQMVCTDAQMERVVGADALWFISTGLVGLEV